MQLKPLNQQVVVLMGASKGMGRLTAHRFAAQGARVVAAARSEHALQTLVQEIEASGGTALAVPADTTRFEQVQAVADQAVEAFGRIDTWVHLAAVGIYARFDQLTPEEWQHVINVNLNGQAFGAMVALPHLKRQGRGALIHIASALGYRAAPLQSVYSASKHGMIGMIDALRVELMQQGIPVSVTTVLPASIDTTFYMQEETKLGIEASPIPPVYAPDLVADAILYAAEHPVRDIHVGTTSRVLSLLRNAPPQMLDSLMIAAGDRWQRTNIAKSSDGPDSVFAASGTYEQVPGRFSGPVLPFSLYPLLEMQPALVREASELVFTGFTSIVTGVVRGLEYVLLPPESPVRTPANQLPPQERATLPPSETVSQP